MSIASTRAGGSVAQGEGGRRGEVLTMRVLFTSSPAYGHLQPMLPLARALQAAGDQVAVAIGPGLCARVEAAGFIALPAGDDVADWWPELSRRHPAQPWANLAAGEILDWFVPHLFGEVGASAMVRDLMPTVRAWRPDILVHETFDFAGPIAAAAAEIPSVHHTLAPLPAARVLHLTGQAVAPLWAQQGLQPRPSAGLLGGLCLDICPPSLRNPDALAIPELQPLRPLPAAAVGDEALPDAMARLSPQPIVHLTLGTSVTNADQAVLRAILEGLRDDPINVVVTVGPDNDPAALGPQPSNVCVERYVAHGLLLPGCAAVITHGGAGTMLAALSHGVPLLTVPQGADQYLNAEICRRRGVGRTLLTHDLTPETAREELRLLLGDPGYREAAVEVQLEIASMPAPSDVIDILHRLPDRSQPLPQLARQGEL